MASTHCLCINTFFVNLPGVNFIQEYTEMLYHNFMQYICTGHMSFGHSLYLYYYELLVALTHLGLALDIQA